MLLVESGEIRGWSVFSLFVPSVMTQLYSASCAGFFASARPVACLELSGHTHATQHSI